MLNRIIEWKEEGIWYEADQRHAEIIANMLGLDQLTVRSGVPVEKLSHDGEDDPGLSAEETKRYRAMVARANYLTRDRSDIHFCVKEIARDMSAPRK